jgi:hypothetical protein
MRKMLPRCFSAGVNNKLLLPGFSQINLKLTKTLAKALKLNFYLPGLKAQGY